MAKNKPTKKRAGDKSGLSSKKFSKHFWEFVEEIDDDVDKLRAKLSQESEDYYVVIMRMYYDAAYAITAHFDKVGYPNGEPSEDGKKDLFMFIVSRGREYYDDLLNHPENLPPGNGDYSTAFLEVPSPLFYDRFQKNLYHEMYYNLSGNEGK